MNEIPTTEWTEIPSGKPEREWNAEFPMDFKGNGQGVAFDDITGAPLFLVWAEQTSYGYETTMWRKLPEPPTVTQRMMAKSK